ncbi:DUF5675 family protein [Planctomyces sp. SH-PL14]|uniref:DUF5675 family protein n=1 Tax=Planctomyces sp. SH-PL14 TaxID=1632864 RepID=UPI00078DE2B5|nr:DUF5675 family protein [Planctomyces sp. SH-PL14]AMV17423.1 hypothetical protein VT03_05995 [Planctomyces sp. SH-PL14]
MTVHDFPRETLTLKRIRSGDDGVFGHLFRSKEQLGVTCEDPWNDNRRGKSCIPTGRYLCVPHSGTKYKGVWEVNGVPGRSAILIHAGYTIDDTQGCILVGQTFGYLSEKPAVLNSRLTLAKLKKLLPDQFILGIQDATNLKPSKE